MSWFDLVTLILIGCWKTSFLKTLKILWKFYPEYWIIVATILMFLTFPCRWSWVSIVFVRQGSKNLVLEMDPVDPGFKKGLEQPGKANSLHFLCSLTQLSNWSIWITTWLQYWNKTPASNPHGVDYSVCWECGFSSQYWEWQYFVFLTNMVWAKRTFKG